MAHTRYPNNGKQKQEDQESHASLGYVKPYLKIRPEDVQSLIAGELTRHA